MISLSYTELRGKGEGDVVCFNWRAVAQWYLVRLLKCLVLWQIIEKTPDGWCEGILNGLTGTFPASFVLEVQPPRSKEELKQLIKLVNLKKKSPDAELDIAIGEDRKSGQGVWEGGKV